MLTFILTIINGVFGGFLFCFFLIAWFMQSVVVTRWLKLRYSYGIFYTQVASILIGFFFMKGIDFLSKSSIKNQCSVGVDYENCYTLNQETFLLIYFAKFFLIILFSTPYQRSKTTEKPYKSMTEVFYQIKVPSSRLDS